MDQTRDRLNMLYKLSFIGKENINLFNKYIPDRYDEIYTLYSLLADVDINYNDISFSYPEAKGDNFTFTGSTTEDILSTLSKYCKKSNNEIKYMRNKAFYVEISKSNPTSFLITFSPVFYREA